jgi:hypothetical protein
LKWFEGGLRLEGGLLRWLEGGLKLKRGLKELETLRHRHFERA